MCYHALCRNKICPTPVNTPEENKRGAYIVNREKDRSREAAGEKGRRAARRGSKAAIVICVILVLVFGAVAAYMIWEKPPERPGGGLVDPTAPSVSPDGDVSASPSAQPTEDPDAGAPASLNENMYTFLVVGLDKVGYNTDTMMIGRMDTKTHEINVVSIPRDTMVNVSWSVKEGQHALRRGHQQRRQRHRPAHGRPQGHPRLPDRLLRGRGPQRLCPARGRHRRRGLQRARGHELLRPVPGPLYKHPRR